MTIHSFIRLFFVGFFACIFSQASLSPAWALQINQVQQKVVSLDNAELFADFNLSRPVEIERSYISIQVKVLNFDHSEAATLVAAYFVDRHTVRVIRQDARARLEVNISVVEFKNGIRVRRGLTNFSKDVYHKRVVTSYVKTKSALSILMVTAPEFQAHDAAHLYFSSAFSDSSTLSIHRSEGFEIKSPESSEEEEDLDSEESESLAAKKEKKEIPRLPMPEATVYWQILEFLDGVTVSNGTAKLPHFAKDTNAYLAAPVQFRDRALIFSNWIAGSNTYGEVGLTSLEAQLSDKSVLLFSRSRKGTKRLEGLNIQWTVLELESAANVVQSGVVQLTANESTQKVSIQPVVLNQSLTLLRTNGGTEDPGVSPLQQTSGLKVIGRLHDSSTLEISRGEDGVSAMPVEVHWTVIQFAPISLHSPEGGETFLSGGVLPIRWDFSAEETERSQKSQKKQTIDIFLSLNAGDDGFPYLIAKDILIGPGKYDWTIPEEIDDKSLTSNQLMIRVEMTTEQGKKHDQSRKPFTVTGSLQLIEPRGKEQWFVGDEQREIKWQYRGKLGVLALYYDTASGFGREAFPPNQRIARVVPGKDGQGVFKWSPIPDLASTRMRVKIMSEADPTVYSISENDFSILPVLKIISPGKNADSFDVEKHQMIKWESTGKMEFVNLYFRTSQTGKWVLSAQNISGNGKNGGAYRWLVPPEAVGDTLQIKLERPDNPDVFDIAPKIGFFQAQSWIRFLKPEDGETLDLKSGAPCEIQWEMGGALKYLNFEYSTDYGKTWIRDAVIEAADKKYIWRVHDAASEVNLIRLSDVKDPEIDCVFKVTSKI